MTFQVTNIVPPYDGDPLFQGTFRWKGVWEGRIYFQEEEEFWGSDLKEMTDLYENHIVPYCKEQIKSHADPQFLQGMNEDKGHV